MKKISILFFLFFLSWYGVQAQSTESEDNYCVEFNGVNDWLDFGASSNIYLTYYTMECWIYPYVQPPHSTMFWGIMGNGGIGDATYHSNLLQRSPVLYIAYQKYIHYSFSAGTEQDWLNITQQTSEKPCITQYAWNHVAVTYDGVDFLCYVNGVLVKEKTTAGSTFPPIQGNAHTEPGIKGFKPTKTAIRYIGRVDWDELFKGLVDDVRIWSYARSAEEIKDNMKVLMSGDESGLIGYWTFNEQQRKAKDKTTRGNDGTLVGPTVKFIKMPLGDDDAMYILRDAIPVQSVKEGAVKDTTISWTFGHKPSDKYKVTVSEVSDETKARIIVNQIDRGDSVDTYLSIKGLKEGMISAKLNFDYGKYHVEHVFLVDVRSAEIGKLPNHTDLGINQAGLAINGASLYADGVYSILDNGGAVSTSGTTDGGTFVSWDFKNDGDFQARIVDGDLTSIDNYGLTVREQANVPSGKSFGVYGSMGKGAQVIYRDQTAGSNSTETTTINNWLRINRTGNLFTAYTTTDPSATWNQIATATIDMPSTAKIGLFVAAANDNQARKKVRFDNVSLIGSLQVLNPLADVRTSSVQTIAFDKVFSTLAGTQYKWSVIPDNIVGVGIEGNNLILTPLSAGTAQVTLTAQNGTNTVEDVINVEIGLLKEGFLSADIWKNPALAIGKSFIAMPTVGDVKINSVVMDRDRNDATNTNVDGITFVAQKKSAAENEMEEITVYLKEIAITGIGVRAGVMFRDDLTSTAAQVGLSCTPYEGLILEYRWLNGVTKDVRTISDVKPPCWLKLTNYKGAYTAFYSKEAENVTPSNWNCVLGTSLIIQMANPQNYVGVFSTTNSSREGRANFSNLKINSYDGHKIACTRTEIKEETKAEKSTVKCSPNPFDGKTKIEFTNPKKGKVDVKLYNSTGVELSVLYSGVANAGVQTYDVDLSAMPTGMYYCKVITNSRVEVVKLMQVK